MSEKNLHDLFISKSKDFFSEENLNIDTKHKKIVNNFYKEIKSDKNFYLKNFREWNFQDDYAVPAQFNIDQIKHNGFFYTSTCAGKPQRLSFVGWLFNRRFNTR